MDSLQQQLAAYHLVEMDVTYTLSIPLPIVIHQGGNDGCLLMQVSAIKGKGSKGTIKLEQLFFVIITSNSKE